MSDKLEFPWKLKVSPEYARSRISKIPHKTCGIGSERHWVVDCDGSIPESSVNWLFCWAKTGMNSPAAAAEARSVFDAIFPVKFREYDAVVNHEHARAKRYGSSDLFRD